MPQAELPLKLIQQSGMAGISRGRLGALVKLEPETLNQLLTALVQAGQAVAYRQGDYLIYRAR